jgi:hypothetical protein
MIKPRPQFNHQALLSQTRNELEKVVSINPGQYNIKTIDCLMSAVAVFSLKYPSLLQFDKSRREDLRLSHNLKTLYGVERAPCDTQMRERLDGLPLSILDNVFKSLFSTLQRSKELERWKFLNQYYLVSLDGTQFFSSEKVHCDYCCEKIYNKGTDKEYKNYNHQIVVGAIVNSRMKQVLPICFEPIIRSDGATKNDCERNASKRWLQNFRRDHPQLPTVIVGDGLSSNGPFIKELLAHRCKYILVAKDKDHKNLCEYFWAGEGSDIFEFTEAVAGVQKRYRYMKNVPLNDTHPDILVTVVYYEQIDKKGKMTKWIWVTNLEITEGNFKNIVEGGRARWKIENETFNTLKNQGYNFEHNYGHGNKTLSNLMAGLMLLAFLIDQCLEAFNVLFQFVLNKNNSKQITWQKVRSALFWFQIESWEKLYCAILDPPIATL